MSTRKRKRQVIEVETYNCFGLPIVAYFDGQRSKWRYTFEHGRYSWRYGILIEATSFSDFAAKTRDMERTSPDEIGEWAFIAEQLIAEGLL